MRYAASKPFPFAGALAIGALAIGALAAGASAQGDYRLQKLTTATFGEQLKLSLTGMPENKLVLVMISLNGGPTPLVQLIGQDTRSLDVGVDLIGEWQFLNSGSGTLQLSIPTPNLVSLQGLPIHLQTVVVPGPGAQIVDKISNKVVVVPGAAGSSALLGARLRVGRGLMSAFVNASLSNSGGDVVLAGGFLGAASLITSDIFDFHTMSIRPGPNMVVGRALNTYTVLPDGRVLIAGGLDNLGNVLANAEIYDPTENSFAPTGSMSGKRVGHAAVLLPDGRVLVVGGAQVLPDPNNLLAFLVAGLVDTAEIYDPEVGTWSTTASIGRKLFAPALTKLNSGKVLISGGAAVTTFFGIPTGLSTTSACQRFDPETSTWSDAATMNTARSLHGPNTVLLKDGRVLVAGGTSISFTFTTQGFGVLAESDVYDPVANVWASIADLAAPSSGHVATRLPDGRVFVTGIGAGSMAAGAGMIVQSFDPTTDGWTRLADLQLSRSGHAALVTPDGMLVLFGGAGAPTTGDSIEVIHP